MKLVSNNPFRVVGLLVGATAKEQDRQIKRLKQYIEAEQNPQDDYSFPVLGTINRTIETVSEASTKLHLDDDKLSAALFWFYNGNEITDEPAFEALKNGGIRESISIWGKLVIDKEITKRNASAYFNWGTLFLNSAFHNKVINETHLEKGIDLKLKFLESDFVKDLKAKATDETFKTSKKEIQISFLKAIQNELEHNGGITPSKLIGILSKKAFSAKEDFLKGFIHKPIEQIEKKIQNTKAKRKAQKSNSANAGRDLYDSVINDLNLLKSILGSNDLKYSSISDKVADEILQCGIEYFLHYRDTSTDPSSISMELFRKANLISIGNIVKQRWKENTDNLQKWINDKPVRDKQNKILSDLERLKKLIDDYAGRNDTVSNAKQLLISAGPHLLNIQRVLGSRDELYLGLSTRIASEAQGKCVSEINKLQNRLNASYDTLNTIFHLQRLVDEAWEVSNMIESMDLHDNFKPNFRKNKSTLQSLRSQLTAVNTQINPPKRSWAEENPGCLIMLIIGAIIFIIGLLSE